MKRLGFILVLIASACGADDGLENAPILAGRIGGNPWTYELGNAFLNNVNGTFELTFFSEEEPSAEACAIAATGLRHITLTVPERPGNYNLPLNGNSAIFHQEQSASSFSATSGFVEITQIVGNQISGYLQATFDADNMVEGQFRLKICN